MTPSTNSTSNSELYLGLSTLFYASAIYLVIFLLMPILAGINYVTEFTTRDRKHVRFKDEEEKLSLTTE
jgi:hypothetical protein